VSSLRTHQPDSGSPRSIKVAAARLSIYSNTALTSLKLIVGLATGSLGVLSEAVHSATDLLASFIAFFSVRVADSPADEKHPYGHGKIESLSGLAEALLIFAAAIYIVYESIHKVIERTGPESVDLGIAVMIASVVVNILVSRHLFLVARETESLALEADAEHLRMDVFTSIGVLAGLILVRATGIRVLDPLAALVVALLIIHAAWRLIRGAVEPLLDTQLPAGEVDMIRGLFDEEPRVLGFHKLRTRKSGSSRHIDAHVLLEDDLTLLEAHDLTEDLEDRIRARLPNAEITLHTEPYRAERRHQFEKHGGPDPDEVDKMQ
jgi:cation diffusion facilitator family transporter